LKDNIIVKVYNNFIYRFKCVRACVRARARVCVCVCCVCETIFQNVYTTALFTKVLLEKF